MALSRPNLRVRRSAPWPLRALATLLVVAQLAPAAAVQADAPPVPAGHTVHIGDRAEPGCEPFHDALHCLTCRVVGGHPLAAAAACRGTPGLERRLAETAPRSVPNGAAVPRAHHARAPPAS